MFLAFAKAEQQRRAEEEEVANFSASCACCRPSGWVNLRLRRRLQLLIKKSSGRRSGRALERLQLLRLLRLQAQRPGQGSSRKKREGRPQMSYSLNSIKRGYIGDTIGHY